MTFTNNSSSNRTQESIAEDVANFRGKIEQIAQGVSGEKNWNGPVKPKSKTVTKAVVSTSMDV